MKIIRYIATAIVLLTSCSDSLYDEFSFRQEEEGLQFQFSTLEMGDEIISMGNSTKAGNTRDTKNSGNSGSSGIYESSSLFAEYPLEGNNPYGLKVHREPLPLMGIHPRTAKAGRLGYSDCSDYSDKPNTRAGGNEIVLTDGSNFHDSLTIWGYTDTGTELFDQILLTKVRNWRNSVEWPYGEGNYMKFYAVAPSMETVNILVNNTVNYSTAPILSYTLPEKFSEMRDLLYGESEHISIASGPAGSVTTNPKQENLGKDNKFVNLAFRHITTAIRFSEGIIPTNLIVKSISLQGIYTRANYNPSVNDEATGTPGTWSGYAATANYTIEPNYTGAGSTNAYIDNDKILFMIPQTLPTGAKLSITVTDTKGTVDTSDDQDHVLTCNIKDDVWRKGYTVNYKITIGQLVEGYYFTVNAVSDIEHSNTAVNGTTNVHSYRLYTDYSTGVQRAIYRPITWTLDNNAYSTDVTHENIAEKTFTSTPPTWLTDFHGVTVPSEAVYEGGDDAVATFTVARQEMAKNTSHDVVLFENSQAGTASSLDLSRYYPYGGDAKATQEPANCYVVTRSGSYTIPLLYGNMTADNTEQKACFKDHQGNTITKYQIREQIGAKRDAEGHSSTEYLWSSAENTYKNLEPTLRVVLLWQDVNGLITSPTIMPNPPSGNNVSCGEIGFTVSQSVPGNAVLALQARKVTYATDYGSLVPTSANTYGPWETIWTWHIWMTDEVYQNQGKEDEQWYDTYFVNGPATNVKGDHIAQVTNWSGTTTDMLPVNLGWVPDDMEFGLFEPRSVWVKLKQSESNNSATVKIYQHARQELYTGTGTVYQWGRPTAFPAVRTVDGAPRTIYDIDGNDITNQFVLAQATSGGDAISMPYGVLQWETNQNSWFDVSSSDYDNAMWSTTGKTVYDPCPPGFRVPAVEVFTGFSKTGSTVEKSAGQLNMYEETENANGETMKNGERLKGGYFYTNQYVDENSPARYSPVVYMPATGEYHGNKAVGTLLSNTSEQLNQACGLFWTSDYSDDGSAKACLLWITPEQSFSDGAPDKPVIGFFGTGDKQFSYSSLRQIRPIK